MSTSRATCTLHGHQMAYLQSVPPDGGLESADGGEEVIVLVHGIAGASSAWEGVFEAFERVGSRRRLIAPDLLGHGGSAGVGNDFSLGGYANGLRDLLAALGHRRVTLVGHSLGGGVALQFTYQFPEMVDRLVLVASGGLGRAVSPALRLASLPGAGMVLPALARTGVLGLGVRFLEAAASASFFAADAVSLREYARHLGSLTDRARYEAFLSTVRTVIGPQGQRISGTDRLYLTAGMPTMLVWGRRDPIIPIGHGVRAAGMLPHARFEVFESSGHFPQADEPERFARLVTGFCDGTEPADIDAAGIGRRLRAAPGGSGPGENRPGGDGPGDAGPGANGPGGAGPDRARSPLSRTRGSGRPAPAGGFARPAG